jgi:hypothetical protein
MPPVEPRVRILGSPSFQALREVRSAFARGGLPPRASRTPEEDARLVVFQTLNELLLLLDQFRGRVERGEPVRLVVTERGAQAGRAIVEIAIVRDEPERR